MHGEKVKIKWYYFHRLEVQSLSNITLKNTSMLWKPTKSNIFIFIILS